MNDEIQHGTAATQASLERLTRSVPADEPQPPVSSRELLTLALMVILSDITIYRSAGFAGVAAFAAGMILLLPIGGVGIRPLPVTWGIAALLAGTAVRLAWCGSGLSVVIGIALLVCFAMSLHGQPPWLIHAAVFASQTFAAGHRGLNYYWNSLSRVRPRASTQGGLAIVLPAITLLVFGTLFLLANPNLFESVSASLSEIISNCRLWLSEYSPHALDILFWISAVWIGTGLLRPCVAQPAIDQTSDSPDEQTNPVPHANLADEPEPAPLFAAYRNTLVVVTVLFAVYLIFEFATLWFREFPEGFHYSGYAHEGAAWLTVALALATVLMSVMFRGRVLRDARIGTLRTLSWIWSFQNVLLAISVFNRLGIYINFNGMTRMRTIGVLGVSAVLVGFILVLRKIARGHTFRWLIRRQLWTVALAGYAYAVLPVDALIMRHNVHQILAGDLAPCVQISVHETSAEGILQIFPLMQCTDETIREGITAILAQHHEQLKAASHARETSGWTAHQFADAILLRRLEESSRDLSVYGNSERRSEAIQEFADFAWQWY